MDFDYHKKNFSVLILIAGAVGALVGALNRAEVSTIGGKVNFFISGMAVSFFITSPFCRHFQLTDIDNVSMISFASGIFGGAVVQQILKGIAKTDILKAVLSKFGLGG